MRYATRLDAGAHRMAGMRLASILFFSAMLIVAALMMRGQWDQLGQRRQRPEDK
jgi:hypothetical protein